MSLDQEDAKAESLMEKIAEKIHGHDSSSSSSSSSSDSDNDESSSLKSKVYRIFGREKPVHNLFGGGKPADIFLWRDKKLSAGVFGGVTAIWFLFEVLEYHLLTLVCHGLIVSLAILFLWSNASNFINKSPPKIPEVSIPEEAVRQTAVALRIEINHGFKILKDVASGRDLKKFLTIIAGLWFFSILGGCFSFLTLFYIVFVALFSVPVIYEKYEDKIDPLAEKAMIEIKKQYAVFDAKVLSKIPKSLNQKKRA